MIAIRSRLRRLVRFRPSRIGLRLLAFNLLLVFLPVAGILYLDVYETQLLEVQERGMVQQARLVAAALGNQDQMAAGDASPLLTRLGRRGDARIRVYDAGGTLIADSARVPDAAADRAADEGAGDYAEVTGVRQRLLYRVGVWLVRLRHAASTVVRRVLVPPRDRSSQVDSSRELSPGPEVRAALQGRYGADTRPTPGQRSVTLYSAVPVRDGDRVVGAAVVSQSTFRILRALYDVRLRIFQIVVASIAAAVVLGLLMSATIVRPLVRLRRAALALSDRRATPASFRRVDRRDEIGDLARTLEDLTVRLEAHIRLLESFAGDVSHEFKNPLASIRVAAEVLAATDDRVERERLLAMLTRDVDRLERLVSGVRELARIDAQIAHEALESVDLSALVGELVDGFRMRGQQVEISFRGAPSHSLVRAAPDRLVQIFENVLENAVGFAPAGSVVEVRVATEESWCVASIVDRGPGIPAAHLERVFERFFSYRPDGPADREHTGLGLAIARAIVEGYGGSIRAANRDGGGACIEIRLPLARRVQPFSRPSQIASGASAVSDT